MIHWSSDFYPSKKKGIAILNTLQKNCVISAVGKNSLHREWTNEYSDFDLHLIVYDDSFDEFRDDSPFICAGKGYKLKLIYHYLQNNPEFLNTYTYFLLPDDDLSMDSETISKLFQIMENYQLQIAQPGLSDSYYYYEHTLRDKFCVLHYTNFVEIMVPCFSRKALQKVLFTFNENCSGWGVEIHWPDLIGFTGKEIAVIDQVRVIHTRPTQSFSTQNIADYHNYLRKYNLKWEIFQTGYILQPQDRTNASERFITDRSTYRLIDDLVVFFIQKMEHIPTCSMGIQELIREVLLLTDYSRVSGKRKYLDLIPTLLKKANENLVRMKNDTGFLSGLFSLSECIETLAQQGIIENNTDEVLEEYIHYLADYLSSNNTDFDLDQFIGLARYSIARMRNPHFGTSEAHSEEKHRLKHLLIAIENQSKTASSTPYLTISPKKLTDYIFVLCEAKKVWVLPEIDWALQRVTKLFEEVSITDQLPYLLKAYVQILAAENTGNKLLKEHTIHEAESYRSTSEKCSFLQLLDIYLLYKMYRHTKEEKFRSQALEMLNQIIEPDDASAIFRQIMESIKEDDTLLIRSGLIFVSVLSDKDSAFEYATL